MRGLLPRTVPTKVPFISDLLHSNNHLFAALTETWLSDHKDAEISIDGYVHFRQDRRRQRKSNRGRDSGGVLIYLREDLAGTAEYILNYSNGVVEVVGVYIKEANLVLITVYRQPDDSTGRNRSTSVEFHQALDVIRDALTSLPSPVPEIVFCGDFNLPHASWTNNGLVCSGASSDERKMMADLQALTTDHFLFQNILKPTHRDGNILDLCFTNNPAFMHSYQCHGTSLSDHLIIEAWTSFQHTTKEDNAQPLNEEPLSTAGIFSSLNFMSEEVDWDNLDRELNSTNWESEFAGLSPTAMLDRFLEISAKASEKFCPKKKQAGKKKRIPRIRRNLMRRRTKINKQLASGPVDSKRQKLNQEAKDIEKKLQESYRNERSAMEHRAVAAVKKNSKYFYSYVRKFSKVFTGIGPLTDAAGNVITCSISMAQLLAEQYCSVFSTPKEPLKSPEDIFSKETGEIRHETLLDIHFSEEDITKAINEISPTAAAGPDGYPAILLKQCCSSLSKPLYMLWRRSLDTGQIPLLLKTAHVIPIHKGGNRGTAKNYRPIALTSHLIKIFEKVLRKRIVDFMELHGLFNPSQHGFRFGRSCLSQLIGHYECILELLENGGNVDVVYIDFAKAFDKVDFGITLQKLQSLGVRGQVGRWIYSFLTQRSQIVLVNDGRSLPSDVLSGVPQGSVLGPLLFLILLGDIDQGLAKAYLSSFADDTRILGHIRSAQDEEDLQRDLDTVYSWTESNNMQLNGDKFECLRYGTGNAPRTTT